MRADGEKRHIGDDQRVVRAACDRADPGGHLIERDRERVVVAERGVPHAVADEDDVDAGVVDDARGRRRTPSAS